MRITLFFIIILFISELQAKTIHVGVLSFRSIAENQIIWQPLADEIHAYNPTLEVNITSASLEDLDKLIAQNGLDFVIVHPGAFVELEYKYGITNIASLVRQTKAEGEHLTLYGGVIVTLSKRHDIKSLSDIRGKTIVTTHKKGTAAMLMQQETLSKAGIDILRDCRMLYVGQPSEKVIKALLAGKADVAFLRTGYIEEMIEKGELQKDELTVISPRTDKNFPYAHSTLLYPEWAVASTSRPSNETVKEFTIALYNVTTDASKDFHTFSIPLSYQSIRELMQKFHTYPFNNPPTLKEILQENSLFVISFFALLSIGSTLFTLYYFISSRRIRYQYKQIESILSTASDGIHIHDLNGVLYQFSDSFAAMLGYTREEMKTMNVYDWDHYFNPEFIHKRMHDLLQNMTIFDTQHTKKDGSVIDVEIHAKGIVIDGKNYIFASSRDITERKNNEIKFLKHQTIFDNIAEGVYAVDTTNKCTYINNAALKMLELSEKEVLGNMPHLLFHCQYAQGGTYDGSSCPIQAAVVDAQAIKLEDVFIRHNGSPFPVYITVSPIIQNTVTIGSVITFIDITEQKAYQNRLSDEKDRFDFMAHHDSLTGLPNRLSLIEYLKIKCSQTTPFAFLFLDLDGFKEINDSYGHRFGDQLLIRVAEVLKTIAPLNSHILRTGGDEFVIIVEYNEEENQINLMMQNLVNTLHHPFSISDIDIYITASVGIAMYPDDATNSEDLFQKADAAMYNAKKTGRNTYSFYESKFTDDSKQKTILSTNLKKAIQSGELSLHYQPQVDHISGQIIGAEALCRWFTPEGAVSPALFIPIAEESGLILEIGEFVLRQGCSDAARWEKNGLLNGRVAINISARQLSNADFITTLDRVISETHCNPKSIELEITESSILEDPQYIIELLRTLKKRGFFISIDDFGTGYSSLSYLKNLPIDKLKIDQSFIRDITNEPKNQTIVKTIIALAKGLGMKVLAEGVETAEELQFLHQHDIDSIQGYYFYKPMDVETIESFLKKNNHI